MHPTIIPVDRVCHTKRQAPQYSFKTPTTSQTSSTENTTSSLSHHSTLHSNAIQPLTPSIQQKSASKSQIQQPPRSKQSPSFSIANSLSIQQSPSITQNSNTTSSWIDNLEQELENIVEIFSSTNTTPSITPRNQSPLNEDGHYHHRPLSLSQNSTDYKNKTTSTNDDHPTTNELTNLNGNHQITTLPSLPEQIPSNSFGNNEMHFSSPSINPNLHSRQQRHPQSQRISSSGQQNHFQPSQQRSDSNSYQHIHQNPSRQSKPLTPTMTTSYQNQHPQQPLLSPYSPHIPHLYIQPQQLPVQHNPLTTPSNRLRSHNTQPPAPLNPQNQRYIKPPSSSAARLITVPGTKKPSANCIPTKSTNSFSQLTSSKSLPKKISTATSMTNITKTKEKQQRTPKPRLQLPPRTKSSSTNNNNFITFTFAIDDDDDQDNECEDCKDCKDCKCGQDSKDPNSNSCQNCKNNVLCNNIKNHLQSPFNTDLPACDDIISNKIRSKADIGEQTQEDEDGDNFHVDLTSFSSHHHSIEVNQTQTSIKSTSTHDKPSQQHKYLSKIPDPTFQTPLKQSTISLSQSTRKKSSCQSLFCGQDIFGTNLNGDGFVLHVSKKQLDKLKSSTRKSQLFSSTTVLHPINSSLSLPPSLLTTSSSPLVLPISPNEENQIFHSIDNSSQPAPSQQQSLRLTEPQVDQISFALDSASLNNRTKNNIHSLSSVKTDDLLIQLDSMQLPSSLSDLHLCPVTDKKQLLSIPQQGSNNENKLQTTRPNSFIRLNTPLKSSHPLPHSTIIQTPNKLTISIPRPMVPLPMTPLSKSGLNPVLLKVARRRREQEWKKEQKQTEKQQEVLLQRKPSELQQHQDLNQRLNLEQSNASSIQSLKKKTTILNIDPPPQPQSRPQPKSIDSSRNPYKRY